LFYSSAKNLLTKREKARGHEGYKNGVKHNFVYTNAHLDLIDFYAYANILKFA